MSRYAVIGHPVAHSKSPFIHSSFARASGKTLSYEAIEVLPEDLASTLNALHAQGYDGLNVTLPHKVAVMALCKNLSERARQAGAVNTLSRVADGWTGDNTDGAGFVADLARLAIAVSGKRVLILGAGGATRGLLAPLLALNPAQLVVSNRNPWKPEELAEAFKPLGVVTPRTHLALKGDAYDLIINATSAGHSGAVPRVPGRILAAGGVCYDLSYGSAHAPFAAWSAQQCAVRVVDGLGMLAGQAAEAFAGWQGVTPDTQAVIDLLSMPEQPSAHVRDRHGPLSRVGQD